jgi:radical SAM superfamily enzyme YgiQ (UPF0313 family)
MRIALIYPNLNGEFRPNLGLLYVATYIEKNSNHDVILVDPTFHRKKWKQYVEEKIKDFSPDIIGYSCLTFNFYDALHINNFLKKKYPSPLSLFGGIHPTLMNLETLKMKNIDLICIGEGELTVKALLDQLENSNSPEGVKGIWYKSNGSIIKNDLRPLEENLDIFPFPNWDFYEIEKYMIVNPYQLDFLGSRGCPYSCAYCSNHALRNLLPGKYVRHRTPQNIIKEIKYDLKKYWSKNFRYVYFWDETFVLKQPFLQEFCNLFIKEKLSKYLTWNCTARADLLREEDVALMKTANCNIIRMGVEAGDPYIRNKIYNRKMSFKSILNAVKLCRKYGIANQLNFIFGGPRETINTMEKTFKIAQSFNPEQISLNTFQPIPATDAAKIIVSNGGSIPKDCWVDLHNFYYKSRIDTSSLNKEQVNKFKRKVDFYFIRKYIFRGLNEKKLRFLRAMLKFFLVLKPQYGFHLHDAYKYTLRRYVYERNLNQVPNT